MASQEIALARCDVPNTLADRMQLAEVLSSASILPDHLRGKPGNVLALQMAATALDIPFFTAAQELHLVKGKVGQSALLMRALVVRDGHRFLTLETTATRAVVQIHRKGEAEPRTAVDFTIEEAAGSGLVKLKDGKPFARDKNGDPLPWEGRTRDMLLARATSRVVRLDAPDVLAGFGYTPDELAEGATEDSTTAARAEAPAPTPQAAPAEDVVDAEVVESGPESVDILLVSLMDCGGDEAFRAAWRTAKDKGWINTLIEGRPVSWHIEQARNACKQGEDWTPPGFDLNSGELAEPATGDAGSPQEGPDGLTVEEWDQADTGAAEAVQAGGAR
jgi:hypothetical protein